MDFLTSFVVICLCAMILGSICSAIRLPPLLGMLIVGIVMGPYVLDLIAPQILDISADLRQLALIIILLRAGLNLDLKNLKNKAFLRCFSVLFPHSWKFAHMCFSACFYSIWQQSTRQSSVA